MHPTRITLYTQTVVQLQHKLCVHSVLPLARRVKQPTYINTQCINCNTAEGFLWPDRNTNTQKPTRTQYTELWNSPGFHLQPEVASGVDRTYLCGFCFVHVRLVGENCVKTVGMQYNGNVILHTL